ncbi:hypothetical protein T439DRAFT_324700 [Meredithblackwellia eburnea MCA 4105]
MRSASDDDEVDADGEIDVEESSERSRNGKSTKGAKDDDQANSRTRKDNHKEVERRRRETINDGINDLKKIVPGCEKNKGSILQRAVQYIQQMKEDEARNIEKWTLEKLLMDQSMGDLRDEVEGFRKHVDIIEVENDQLRQENDHLRAEIVRLSGGGSEKRKSDGAFGGDDGRDDKRLRV